jgi:hypothetical protein
MRLITAARLQLAMIRIYIDTPPSGDYTDDLSFPSPAANQTCCFASWFRLFLASISDCMIQMRARDVRLETEQPAANQPE